MSSAPPLTILNAQAFHYTNSVDTSLDVGGELSAESQIFGAAALAGRKNRPPSFKKSKTTSAIARAN